MAVKSKPQSLHLGDVIPLAGGRQAEWSREASGEHIGNEHFRTIDTLGTMMKNGTITSQMHDAGQDFTATFVLAQLSGPSVPSFNRIPGGQWRDSMTERVALPVSGSARPWMPWAGSVAQEARRSGMSPVSA